MTYMSNIKNPIISFHFHEKGKQAVLSFFFNLRGKHGNC